MIFLQFSPLLNIFLVILYLINDLLVLCLADIDEAAGEMSRSTQPVFRTILKETECQKHVLPQTTSTCYTASC